MRRRIFSLSVLLLVVVAVDAVPAWFNPQNLNSFLGVVSPFFKNPEEARAADNLKAIRETIEKSATENEGWTELSKRIVTLATTGKKDLALKKKISGATLAKGLYDASPQVVKDMAEAKQKGFMKTFVNRFQKVMALKDKQPTAEEKQAGLDSFVLGMNGLLNFAYTSSMAAFMLPTMGLDNLFNPNPDYDYDALEEGDEEVEAAPSEEEEEEAPQQQQQQQGQRGSQEGSQQQFQSVSQEGSQQQFQSVSQEGSQQQFQSGSQEGFQGGSQEGFQGGSQEGFQQQFQGGSQEGFRQEPAGVSQEAGFNPVGSFLSPNNQVDGHSSHPQQMSSYVHYTGQAMPLPNHIAVNHQLHNWNHNPKFHMFKMYKPDNRKA